MSQENVELARQANEAWNSGDWAAFSELIDPDAIVARQLDGWPEARGPSIGREAVLDLYRVAREAWQTETMEPLSFTDAGDSVVVRQVWRASGHGPDLAMEFTAILTMRSGRIFLAEFYWDHAEALKAVGLEE